MELKRIYDGAKVIGVRIKHSGFEAKQKWASRQIEQYLAEGWMTMRGDEIVITDESGEQLVYEIVRRPGYYCTSSGQRIPISEPAMQQFMTQIEATLAPKEARAWLAAHDRPADDYTPSRNYECVLSDECHAKHRAVVGPKGQIAAAHKLEG